MVFAVHARRKRQETLLSRFRWSKLSDFCHARDMLGLGQQLGQTFPTQVERCVLRKAKCEFKTSLRHTDTLAKALDTFTTIDLLSSHAKMDHRSQNDVDHVAFEEEQDSRHGPPELLNNTSLTAEIGFVLVCAAGQLIFTLTLGQVVVAQAAIQQALALAPTQTPWLVGASLIPSGLSVIIAGSLADLVMPKRMMVGAFCWAAACNAAAAGAVVLDRPPPARAALFLVTRALHGLAVGVLVSASMSLLGRVYKPGIRKTRVFSLMGAGAPFGFWIGCLQGGALSSFLPWIFGSTAIFLALLAIGAHLILPNLGTSRDEPSVEQFDYFGAFFATSGCGLILSGLTQGPAAGWNSYTYTLVILGVLMLTAFSWVERRATRPLVPSGLWRTPGLKPLLVSYFLGFGGYSEYLLFAC